MSTNSLPQLSLSYSSFEVLRRDGYLYVDKTKMLYDLILKKQFYFIIRPRRFGKSVMLSTFKAIFSGKKQLFEGLWIGNSDYTWPIYPVIYLDFSLVTFDTYEGYLASFDLLLSMVAKEHNSDISEFASTGDKLYGLIKNLAKDGQVVILIDEYDKILYDRLANKELVQRIQASLAQIYGVFKALNELIAFMFITGVSNFAKSTLLSGMNNIVDISLLPLASTLLGYTHQELDTYLGPHIESCAQANGYTPEKMRQELIEWYDGYRFAKNSELVFNPTSIAYALTFQDLSNYWTQTGSASYLIQTIIKERTRVPVDQPIQVRAHELAPHTLADISTIALMYQAGYLTIVDYDASTDTYSLNYPNRELSKSFQEDLIEGYKPHILKLIGKSYEILRDALEAQDINEFCKQLKPLLTKLSYFTHVRREAYYHSIIQIIFELLPCETISELHTDKGRIDLVVKTDDIIYIFEFKLKKTAQEAIDQIIDRAYYERFLHDDKKVIFVGIAFKPGKAGLDYEYKIQELTPQ